jgi:hypothetical protein
MLDKFRFTLFFFNFDVFLLKLLVIFSLNPDSGKEFFSQTAYRLRDASSLMIKFTYENKDKKECEVEHA